jgi:hypothetical protein
MHALVGKSGAIEQPEVEDELLRRKSAALVVSVFDVGGVSARQLAIQAIRDPVQQDESLLARDEHRRLLGEHRNIADIAVLGTGKFGLESNAQISSWRISQITYRDERDDAAKVKADRDPGAELTSDLARYIDQRQQEHNEGRPACCGSPSAGIVKAEKSDHGTRSGFQISRSDAAPLALVMGYEGQVDDLAPRGLP